MHTTQLEKLLNATQSMHMDDKDPKTVHWVVCLMDFITANSPTYDFTWIGSNCISCKGD